MCIIIQQTADIIQGKHRSITNLGDITPEELTTSSRNVVGAERAEKIGNICPTEPWTAAKFNAQTVFILGKENTGDVAQMRKG